MRSLRGSRIGPSRLLALLAALAALGPGCDRPVEPRSPRLVLLYAPCTVRREQLAPYDPEVDYTPNLERLAREGIVFRRNVSEAGQSGTAYACLFSGAQADVHGVFAHPTRIPDDVTLVSEAFAAAGFDTYFWGGHPLANGTYGYGQGVPAENAFDYGLHAEDPRFREILQRLRDDPDYRAFVMTDFTVTHAPYTTRNLRTFRARYPERAEAVAPRINSLERYLKIYASNSIRLSNDFPGTVERLGLSAEEVREMARVLELVYESNVHFLDERFGEVLTTLEAAGVLDESLVVFTADHGENLFHEGVLFPWTHGWELAPDVLTTPWIVRLPDALRAGTSYEAVTRSMDLFPTLAGLAGIPVHATTVRGEDLTGAILGREPPPHLLAYSHTTVLAAQFADRVRNAAQWLRYHGGVLSDQMWVGLRDRDRLYKFRNLDGERWGFQAFDLSTDPLAAKDVFDSTDTRDRDAQGLLLAYRERLLTAWRQERAAPAVDPAAEAALRALGYVE